MPRVPKKQNISSVPSGTETVRISIPASVAADLGNFHKSIIEILERMGCGKCFSGADCMFHLERDFIINERLEVQARHIDNFIADPSPQPNLMLNARPVVRPVTVRMPAKVSNDLDSVLNVISQVAEHLGCAACCSGFDIHFQRELDFLVNPALEVHAL